MLTYHFVVTRSNGTLYSANFGIKVHMIENEDRGQGRAAGGLSGFFLKAQMKVLCTFLYVERRRVIIVKLSACFLHLISVLVVSEELCACKKYKKSVKMYKE